MSGELDKAGGKVKEVAGKATGDRSLQARGKGQNLSGKAQNAAGHVRDVAADAKRRMTAERPQR